MGIKPKEKKIFFNYIAELPCLVCGSQSTIHHVTGYADKMGRASRRDDRVVPLCPRHHQIQWGPKESVEAIGHRGFYVMHGINLMAEAEKLADKFLAIKEAQSQ